MHADLFLNCAVMVALRFYVVLFLLWNTKGFVLFWVSEAYKGECLPPLKAG